MLCIFIYFLNSAVSDNKHELIQVAVAANVTVHKRSTSYKASPKYHLLGKTLVYLGR